MSKKSSVVILSLVTALLAVALVMGITFALFSDSAEVTNHLQAGTLKVKLYRDSLESVRLNEEGLLITTAKNTETKDFTGSSNENIFEIKDGEYVVPGSSYTAGMRLVNDGDVAFGYWIELKVTVDGKESQAFAEQLKLSVTPENGTALNTTFAANEFKLGSDEAPVATVLVAAEGKFTVTVAFDNNDDNNDAQLGHISFDLIVHAIQIVG